MSAITKIDRAAIKLIGADVDIAMEAIAEKYGMTYKRGSGRFSDTTYSTKGDFSVHGDPDASRAEFVRNLPLVRDHQGQQVFTESDFGRTFVTGRRSYTINGLHPSRPAYPVSATRDDGKGFKFPAEAVKGFLATTANR